MKNTKMISLLVPIISVLLAFTAHVTLPADERVMFITASPSRVYARSWMTILKCVISDLNRGRNSLYWA